MMGFESPPGDMDNLEAYKLAITELVRADGLPDLSLSDELRYQQGILKNILSKHQKHWSAVWEEALQFVLDD